MRFERIMHQQQLQERILRQVQEQGLTATMTATATATATTLNIKH